MNAAEVRFDIALTFAEEMSVKVAADALGLPLEYGFFEGRPTRAIMPRASIEQWARSKWEFRDQLISNGMRWKRATSLVQDFFESIDRLRSEIVSPRTAYLQAQES